MPTGVILKDKQGNMQKVPFDQLQQVDPFLYSKYVQNVAQPQAQLQETQLAAGAAGASAALSTAELPGAQARSKVAQAPVNQLDVINKAGDYFESHKGKDGYVSPQDYNNYKAQYVQSNGNADEFDAKFGANYINPKNAFYDTPDAKMARSTLPVIKNIIDSYRSLPKAGPEWGALANLPGIGPYLQQKFLGAEKAHNDLLMGQAGNIRQIAGAGPGQGFRFNLQELNNITGMLPGAYDSKEVANQKLDRLDTFLKSNMGISLDDLYQ